MSEQAVIELPQEYWRSVVGYEGLYSISNLGRVLSHSRLVVRHGGNNNYTTKPRILKPSRGVDNPYLSLGLTKDSQTTTHYVHALVLNAFVGPRPYGMDACHGDGDSMNNCANNLRWDTRAGNHADKKIHGTGTVGTKHPMAKLDDRSVRAIRRLHKAGVCICNVLRYFHISRMTHWRVVNRVLWRHVV